MWLDEGDGRSGPLVEIRFGVTAEFFWARLPESRRPLYELVRRKFEDAIEGDGDLAGVTGFEVAYLVFFSQLLVPALLGEDGGGTLTRLLEFLHSVFMYVGPGADVVRDDVVANVIHKLIETDFESVVRSNYPQLGQFLDAYS